MTIPEELLQKWENLKSEGDNGKLSDLLGRTPQTVLNIFKSGSCSDEQFKTIADFYKEKEDLIKEYL